MPERIQLRRTRGWRMPDGALKVDRTTKWGNPFIVGKHGTRARCIDLYIKLVDGLLCLGFDNIPEQQRCREAIQNDLSSLRGKSLACWCALPKAGEVDLCHAAVLLRISNS